MKFKRYKTVDKLLVDTLPDSEKTIETMNRMFEEDAVSQHLFILRTKAGVSQADMANRLKVSQSVISKMENNGNYLKFNEVIRYISALGFSAELGVIKGDRTVDLLRFYFERITQIMGELQEMAGDDLAITTGVATAFKDFSQSMMDNVIPGLKKVLDKQLAALQISVEQPAKPKAESSKPRKREKAIA